MNEKKTEVIYIDNRVPGTQNCPVSVNNAADSESGTADEPEQTGQQSKPDSETQTETAETAQEPEEKEQTAEAKTEPAVKRFFDRDCAVSKSGRTYSVEELNDQIKE